MRFWRDRIGSKPRETHHHDGKYIIREIHKLTHMRMSDFLHRYGKNKTHDDYERFQTIHRLDEALRNAEGFLFDEPRR